MKQNPAHKSPNIDKNAFLFTRDNYIIMIIGLVLIATGLVLMIGGGSDDPAIFENSIFNTQRLVVSPLLLIAGYALQFFAIFYKKKNKMPEQ